jgi:uncharacterized protein with HEPN domain
VKSDDRSQFLELCGHIAEWGERIPAIIGERNFEEFTKDQVTYLAVWKCVEVLGEASSKILRLDENLDSAYPQLMLRSARSMRNQLTHGYSVMDLGVLWRTVHAFVPGMVKAARSIVEKAGENDGPGA